jgi:Tol biopolymer transport system component
MRPFLMLWQNSLSILGIVAIAFCASGCVQRHVGRPAISSEGAEILFGSSHESAGDLYSFNLKSLRLTRLTSRTPPSDWPSVSPDGRSIAFCSRASSSGGWHISLMDIQSRHQAQLTCGETSDIGPSFSRDGKHIVFARASRYRPYSMGGMVWDHWDIWVMGSDGSNPIRLTHGDYYGIDPPYFSPDGNKIVFGATPFEDRDTTNHLFILELGADMAAKALTQIPSKSYDAQPSFAPDGERIAFISRRVSRAAPYDYEIWTADLDGGHPRQVTHNQSLNMFPIFSPDGTHIYFVSDPTRTNACELWQIASDGSEPRRLIPRRGGQRQVALPP